MSKRQTRRSISVKAETYASLGEHCRKHGLSVSGFVETLCTIGLREAGARQVPREEALKLPRRKRGESVENLDAIPGREEERAGSVFSW